MRQTHHQMLHQLLQVKHLLRLPRKGLRQSSSSRKLKMDMAVLMVVLGRLRWPT